MKVKASSMFIALLMVINALLMTLPGQLQLISMCLSIAIGCYIFVLSLKNVYSSGDIFQPILICNVFLALFFILRPIWLLLSADSLGTLGFFKYYEIAWGRKEFFEYPVAKAEFIGVLGMFFINQGYFTNLRLKNIKPFKGTLDNTLKCDDRSSIDGACWFLLGGAFLFWLLYMYRGFVQGGSMSMIYVIWVYILTVTLPIYIAHKGKIDLFTVIILGISIISLVTLGNRQLIVSLLLCVAVSQIQFNTNSTKRFGKTALMLCAVAVGLAFVVVWFASVRYDRNLSINTAIDSLFGEFAMYDMLVVSLDAELAGFVPRYFGYNFLDFFSYFVPSIDILPFDHQLVQDVFRGVIGGGVPASAVGSLYINFGYIGLVVLSFVLGRCFSAVYVNNRKKETLLGDLQNIIFLTFVYDLTRVGGFGREFVNYIVMYLCLKIAFLFISRKQDVFVFNQVHGKRG